MLRSLLVLLLGCGSDCPSLASPNPGEYLVLDAVDPRLVGTVAEIRETEAGLVLVLRYEEDGETYESTWVH